MRQALPKAQTALTQGMLILRGENTIYAVGERKTSKND